MNIDIKTLGFGLTRGLREHVIHRLATGLGRFEARLRQVVVRLSDLNGPRGGVDKHCQLLVRIDGASPIVVRDTEEDLYVAVDRAAERAGRTLARQVQRSHRISDRRSASGEPT